MSKAIVLVAFGSGYLEGIENSINLLEQYLRVKLKNEYLVITAFTSKRVISLLRERYDVNIPHLTEALFNLTNDGYNEVIIQPLHMISENENNEVIDIANEYKYAFKKIELKNPLLSNERNLMNLVNILANSIEEGYVLLAGHGSKNKNDDIYIKIKNELQKKIGDRVYLANIEGELSINKVIENIKTKDIKEITIKPLFIIPGKHIIHDICQGEHSWFTMLEQLGIKIRISKTSLLQYEDINKMFFNQIIS